MAIFEKTYGTGVKFQLLQGDLTAERVDVIVNAANARLQHGGGLAGAIVRRGGAEIQKESDAWVRDRGQVSHGSPAITGAGKLYCKAVVHAVGPIWGEGDEDAKLAAAVTESLRLANEKGFVTLALSAISTGIFGFPKARGAKVILDAIDLFCRQETGSLREIRMVILDQETLSIFFTECGRKWK